MSGRSQKILLKDVLASEREITTDYLNNWFYLLFSCYSIPLELIFKQLNINDHFYADDTDIYFVYEETVTQENIDLIISTLRKRFRGAKLKLNFGKTEFIKVVEKTFFQC